MASIESEAAWVRDVRGTLKNADQDFQAVKPWIYWRDMIIGATIAYTAASVYIYAEAFSLWQIGGFVVAIFWLYRVGSLVHEVAHLGGKEMTFFKVAWNILVGVPTLTPSTFFTGHHRDHHTQRVYGTPEDPEYVVNVCKRGSKLNLLLYFGFVAIFPIVIFLRFLFAPLTFITPRIREYTLRNLSAFTFNWKYKRQVSRIDRKAFAALELICWFRASLIPAVAIAGLVPWTHPFKLYALGATVVIMNQLRQLADHHFEGNGENLSVSEHIQDSCNHLGRDPLTILFFPFAIQYHALHHMFPSLPYHNLAVAHNYLIKELPATSPYRDLSQHGWWSVAKNMLRVGPKPADVSASVGQETTYEQETPIEQQGLPVNEDRQKRLRREQREREKAPL